MLTNYVFVIPVKYICGKTLVHEYIYKVYLPFGCTEKFLSDKGTSFINKHLRNSAKVLSFKHIQSSPRNPRVNGKIENIHNFLKHTMRKIMHGNDMIKWHYRWPPTIINTFPSTTNWYSPFLLQRRSKLTLEQAESREHSHQTYCKATLQHLYTNCTSSGRHIQLKSWKNRSKNDSDKITQDPPLKINKVLIMNYHAHGLDPRFYSDWRILKFNLDRQVIVVNTVRDTRTLSTRHVKKATNLDIIFPHVISSNQAEKYKERKTERVWIIVQKVRWQFDSFEFFLLFWSFRHTHTEEKVNPLQKSPTQTTNCWKT